MMSSDSDIPAQSSDWTVAHDFVMTYGGAEWVTQVLSHETFPGSRLLYLAGDPLLVDRMTSGERQRVLPGVYNRLTYRALLPTYAGVLERVPPVRGNLIASSYAFAHHLRCEGTKVTYCHSPLRQAWSGLSSYRTAGSLGERIGLGLVKDRVRRQDVAAALTADLYVASSRAVEERIRAFYGIDQVLRVPPPVNTEVYHRQDLPREDFFLWVGRIVEPYKRLGLVVDAFADDLSRRLVVVGDGRSRRALERRATPNVDFVGWAAPSTLARLYSTARALVFPSEDDFGIVPVEAMACGTPVIAYRGGGALDTVVDDRTGIFFDESSSEALTAALRRFDEASWDEDDISHYATKGYSPTAFSSAITRAVNSL